MTVDIVLLCRSSKIFENIVNYKKKDKLEHSTHKTFYQLPLLLLLPANNDIGEKVLNFLNEAGSTFEIDTLYK